MRQSRGLFFLQAQASYVYVLYRQIASGSMRRVFVWLPYFRFPFIQWNQLFKASWYAISYSKGYRKRSSKKVLENNLRYQERMCLI